MLASLQAVKGKDCETISSLLHHEPQLATGEHQAPKGQHWICQLLSQERNNGTRGDGSQRLASADQTQEEGNGFDFFKCVDKMKHLEN